jgi:hypothetical protein
VRLVVTAHGDDVTLDEAAWERLVPAGTGEDTSYRSEAPAGQSIRQWFGETRLQAGEERASVPIALPASGPAGAALVFKVAATDTAGHHLAAWVEAVAPATSR